MGIRIAVRIGPLRVVAATITAVAFLANGALVFPQAAAAHSDAYRPVLLPTYLESRDINPNLKYDASGVAMVDYGSPLGIQYNPTMVAQQALGFYARFLRTGAAEDRKGFFTQVDWLVSTQTSDGRFLYHFKWGDQPIPWWSAMAQGQAMSALIRAYFLSGEPRYRDAVERARSRFDMVISRLGVDSWFRVRGRDYVIYEEAMGTYCPRVLNGWMFAVIGLYEDWIYLHDVKAKFALYNGDRGFAALKVLLPYYDTGTWSYYNLKTLTGPNPPASDNYAAVHVVELRYLARVTGDRTLAYYADRFARYARSHGIKV